MAFGTADMQRAGLPVLPENIPEYFRMPLFYSRLSSFMTIATLSCVVALPLTGCAQPVNEMKQPEYRGNPNPQKAYRLTMTIEDAPGPLKIVVSAGQYDVVNTECLPPPKDNPGGRSSPVPTNDIPFELTQVSEGVYTGTVYADAMIDEDYHGRGTCQWKLTRAQVQLKATGAGDETKFIASLSRHDGDFGPGRPKTFYYSKRSYPRRPDAKLDNPVNFGQTDRSRVVSYLADRDLFAITLRVEDTAS